MKTQLFNRDYFHDKPVMLLAGVNTVLASINIIFVLLRTNQVDFEVPVRYSQYATSPLELGDWFTHYELALFAFVMTLINVGLSMKIRPIRRHLSVTVLVLNIVLMVYLFVVSQAIIGRIPG